MVCTSHLDTYQLLRTGNGYVPIDEENIAWRADLDYVFQRPENYTAVQWTDVRNGGL